MTFSTLAHMALIAAILTGLSRFSSYINLENSSFSGKHPFLSRHSNSLACMYALPSRIHCYIPFFIYNSVQ